MSLSVKYNGHELNEYLTVTGLRRGIGTTRTNILQKMGMARGSKYLGYTKDFKVYEMDFALIYSVTPKRRELARILDSKEPSELIFGDEPNKYCLAIPDGDIDVDDDSFLGKGTITWLIPDGISYSKNLKTFTASENSEGILQMEIDNRGTEECPVAIEADFHSDNGLFAVVSPYNVIEVGNRDEVDGHDYQQTDTVANNTLTPADQSNWIENSPNARTYYPIAVSGIANQFGVGSFSWPAGSNGPEPNFPANTQARWVGPTLYRTFAANSNNVRTGNFEYIWRFDMRTTTIKQIGRQEFTLQNGTDLIVSMVIRDSSASKTELKGEIHFFPPDGDSYRHDFTVDLKKVKGKWFDIRLSRMGAKLTMTLSNINTLGTENNVREAHYVYTKSFVEDRLQNVAVNAVTYWAHARYSNNPVPENLRPTHFVFRWINVEKWSDDPNRYTDGDQMIIDSREGKTYLNGIPILNDVVKGSEYIKVPPGRTILQFAYSDFAQMPTVSATIQEVFL